MWVRNNVLVAATVAALTIAWAGPARAQGPAAPAPPAAETTRGSSCAIIAIILTRRLEVS